MTGTEKHKLIELLDSLVMAAGPRAEKVAKYGATLYTSKLDEKEGQFRCVFPYMAHVQLPFAQGALIEDPDGLLERGGKFRRHLTLKSIGEVEIKVVKHFVKSSSKV